MKKFKATFYGLCPNINVIDVKRETEHCVFLSDTIYGERRFSKESSCEYFADTLGDARVWVMDKIQIEMAHKKAQVEAAQERLAALETELERAKTMEAE
jgi:hypothetical protein